MMGFLTASFIEFAPIVGSISALQVSPSLPASVSAEEVAGIDFVLHIVEAGIVAVGDDGLRL